jgi:hypothetical protein
MKYNYTFFIFLSIYFIIILFFTLKSQTGESFTLKSELFSFLQSYYFVYDLPLIQTILTDDPQKFNELKTKADNAWVTWQLHGFKNRYVLDNQEANILLDELEYKHPELQLKQIYTNISQGVAKSDIMRCIALYLRGGIYADYSKILKTDKLKDSNVILFTERIIDEPYHINIDDISHIRRLAYNYNCIEKLQEDRIRIFSGLMISKEKENKFFYYVLEEISKRFRCLKDYKIRDPKDILFFTGPDTVSTIYQKYKFNDVFRYTVDETKDMIEWDISLGSNWRNDI